MPLPAPLSRRNPHQHKNDFGHILVLAGSARMLGAAALTCQAAMRAGAGLVTLGIPRSLNLTAQKKISSVVMTLPLAETPGQALSLKALTTLQKELYRYQVIALGPGLSRDHSTQKLILKIISMCDVPLVIDADALNALATQLTALHKQNNIRILTPHAGEMGRLINKRISNNEKQRILIARQFAQEHNCILTLKGRRTIVADPQGRIYINTTGNVGMATAGSGDILTGIIAAFLAQKLKAFDAVKLACLVHGRSGDLAAKEKGKISLIATDMIEKLPQAIKFTEKRFSSV